jgi:hypothetical protein
MAKENCVDHSDYVGGAIAMANKMCSPLYVWMGRLEFILIPTYV